ncbi:MAG TPA: ABC transporter substrate-binding protein, partial [Chloroflexia bacterium]|nr:ABC transporter substrate-binding protein [Chloroflexia bacterium]
MSSSRKVAAGRRVYRVSQRRKMSALALVGVLLMVLLSGCWPFPPDSSSSGSTTPQPRSTVTSSDNVGEEDLTPLPTSNDALNIAGQTDDPPSLDPALASDSYSLFVIRQLFSGLVTFDNELNIVPDIAATMPAVSPDGKTYTFVLRKGVRFPDGQEVTSADFKYSFERASDPKLAGSQP